MQETLCDIRVAEWAIVLGLRLARICTTCAARWHGVEVIVTYGHEPKLSYTNL